MPFLQVFAVLAVAAMRRIDDVIAPSLVGYMLDGLHGLGPLRRARLKWLYRFHEGRFQSMFERALSIADPARMFPHRAVA